ncbi:MAG: TonB-dependent receptor, partial [Labilithrix sp.]
SEIGSSDGLAGVPSILWQKSLPYTHSITDFSAQTKGRTGTFPFGTIPAGVCAGAIFDANGDVVRDPQCPTTTYFQGGPDYIDDAQLDRYHGKLILTKLFQGLGHHVVKAGLDFEQMSYDHKKAYSGHVRYSENGSGSAFNESRQYGFLTGPDTAVIQDFQRANSSSSSLGAFVQDSWSLLDKVTLNLGVRYDSQYVFGNDGKVAIALPTEFSPRVGVIYDITQQGRSKIYASFARYYESIPLDISDRGFPGESQVGSRHAAYRGPQSNPDTTCDPRTLAGATGLCTQDVTRRARSRVFGTPYDPNQYWFATGNAKVPVDPNLQPQASDEITVGGEYEIFPDGRLGVSYVHRYMVEVIEDMSRDEATTYFIGNPGSGIAKDFPHGQRDYDGVSLFFTKNFSDKWLAQVSYTLSYLRGNIGGLYRSETGQLDPNANSDFDLKSLTVNRYGPLPGDSTHEIKVYAARDFPFNEFFNGPNYMQLNLGLGYSGRTGGPTSFLGAHPIYGNSEVQILPRGAGERLPYVHRFDGHLQYDLKLSKASALSVYMDIFNIFNFQEVTAVDEDYTFSEVTPLVDAKPVKGADGKMGPKVCTAGVSPDCLQHPDGTPFLASEKNPNYGKPAAYQSPRTFRFGAKVTF